MKLLSIGNSFSQDAHAWLHEMAHAAGTDLYTVNLYIGGCSLERHMVCWRTGASDYCCEINGRTDQAFPISLAEGLTLENWDVVTLQQASHDSGRPQTYFPYLTQLYDIVREKAPHAAVYIHQTWAYEADAPLPMYAAYQNQQGEMYRRLTDAYDMASRVIGAPLLPCGRVIQTLRETTEAFDYRKTGRSLNRDGFHLSLDYGRYAASATWLSMLTETDVRDNPFVPVVDGQAADPALLAVIRETVHAVCHP